MFNLVLFVSLSSDEVSVLCVISESSSARIEDEFVVVSIQIFVESVGLNSSVWRILSGFVIVVSTGVVVVLLLVSGVKVKGWSVVGIY